MMMSINIMKLVELIRSFFLLNPVF